MEHKKTQTSKNFFFNRVLVFKALSFFKRFFDLRSLAFRLYGGLVLFVLFILLSSFLSGRSVFRFVDQQKTLMTQNIPELMLIHSIVRQSERLINQAPRLQAAGTEEQIQQVKNHIVEDKNTLQSLLRDFKKLRVFKNSSQVADLVQQITKNLSAIEFSVLKKNQLTQKLQALSLKASQEARKIYTLLVTEIDNKTFDLAVKSRVISLSFKELKPLKLKEILLYQQLLNFQSQVNMAVHLLQQGVGLKDPDLMEPLRERFLAAMESCEKALRTFPPSYTELKTGVQQLKQSGFARSHGIFALKQQIFKLENTQAQYLKNNKMISQNLLNTVEEISRGTQQSNQKSLALFENSSKTNQRFFIVINLISVLGAMALAGFFINPLIRRLTYLSKRMRGMSKGDLKSPVQVQGKDEITDMAQALEVFRKHAFEVSRLNLVEKLAQEVQSKNRALQKTIKDLHSTRDKLVIQEKLASLGQLTSGIAHEIKNPLNFINNFSKLSKSLTQDLSEELKKTGTSLKPETLDFVQSLIQDLSSNLQKIAEHGGRVNDIITGMLQHSRGGSTQKEDVDINKYMDTYSGLAFHSKRSLDSHFNVVFKKDYDPSLGCIKAVPQDISRVILNIIANACDAVQTHSSQKPPCIYLKTVRGKDKIKISIKDTGPGIPSEIKDKIFNPFFTTKPTGQGTGLGLSLVHDMVTKYEGSLSVNSKEGEFSEFVITLPA